MTNNRSEEYSLHEKIRTLSEDNKALLEALRPFAELCEAFYGKQRGLAQYVSFVAHVDEDAIYAFNNVSITLGDLRRARALLRGRV